MRMLIKKVCSILCLLALLFLPLGAYAQSSVRAGTEVPAESPAAPADAAREILIDEAIRLGLANSIVLKQVQNEIDISEAYNKQALSDGRDLVKGERDLDDADDEISRGKRDLSSAKSSLDAAQTLLDGGKAPQDITLPSAETGLPVSITVRTGENIYSKSHDALTGAGIDNSTADTYAQAVTSTAVGEIQGGLDAKAEEIDAGYSKLTDAMNQVDRGREKLEKGLEEAEKSISEKLGTYDTDRLDLDDAANLIASMAGINYDVTAYSYAVYRNKLALLIEKESLDVLKSKKLVEVMGNSMKRAEKQADFAAGSYNEGVSSRDDMLLAQIYLGKTKIQYRKAQGALSNAELQLKKDMGVDAEEEIKLQGILTDDTSVTDPEEGLKNGLENRVEIRKASGFQTIYGAYFDAIKKTYKENAFQYKEAGLLKEKADLNLESVKMDIENSIRQAYENVKTTADMLKIAADMVKQAQENLDIAKYKYELGFGVENSLLKSLNIENTAGTIVEVLAAEENLSQVEEAQVEIIYSYNLAKANYSNEIAGFTY